MSASAAPNSSNQVPMATSATATTATTSAASAASPVAATPPPVDIHFLRPPSEFDAGLNTSTVWTEHLERTSTYQTASDDEKEENVRGKPARALYDFEGKAEFRELTMKAGDEIEVLKEQLPDGWSLVSISGEVGLIPMTYYAFTTDFTSGPTLHEKEDSTSTIGPRSNKSPPGSSLRSTTPPPLANQRTGEWSYGLPNFRQSLLGGKSINRFSSFVTSGAEEWVLKGTAADITPLSPASPFLTQNSHTREASTSMGAVVSLHQDEQSPEDEEEAARIEAAREAEQHYVEAGTIWKPKLPEFRILIHSPSKRSSTLSGSYTVYTVTSVFNTPEDDAKEAGEDQEEEDPPVPSSPKRISVHRRFSHFVFLHTALSKRLPGIALPPLPEKQYAGRFSEDFVEARRNDLERYLNRIVRHPIARYAEVVNFFLSCDSEIEWKKRLPYHLSLPPAGPQFYAKVFHPAYNLDADEAIESVEKFNRHLKAVGKGVQGLRGMFTGLRQARMDLARYQRLFSYSIFSLITSTPLASTSTTSPTLDTFGEEEEEEEDTSRAGLLNSEGAWCWKDNCDGCLRLTKAMQKTAETLQNVADLQEDNARRTQLGSHESLKDVAHPSSLYSSVVETHRATLSRYKSAIQEGNDDLAARCETVLNTTMSEFSTYHSQKQEDFEKLTLDYLNGEIELYTEILGKLQAAKATFYTPHWEELSMTRSGPRKSSIYEKDLSSVDPRSGRIMPSANNYGNNHGGGNAPREAKSSSSSRGGPLIEPAPHVWDSTPMRPVSAAIHEGVGMLFGSSSVASLYGRGSVFGKFW